MMVRSGMRFVQPLTALLAAIAIAGPAAHAQDAAEAREEFIARMVAEHGFGRSELDALFAGVGINDGVLQAISKPAERVLAWHEYRDIFVTDARVSSGMEFWSQYADEIHVAAEQHGVAPEIIVAIVGIETWFGTRMGRYRVLESLSTLAFAYPPRARFFANELESFLLLTREEGIDPTGVLGSYAGAMGIPQFIPSSYRAYAVDFDGDGQRDLIGSVADAIGSVAAYLSRHGWVRDGAVAVPATVSGDAAGALAAKGLEPQTSIAAFARAGVEPTVRVAGDADAALVELEGAQGLEYWLGFRNFYVVTRYNRSPLYAMAVHQLADAIEARTRGAAR